MMNVKKLGLPAAAALLAVFIALAGASSAAPEKPATAIVSMEVAAAPQQAAADLDRYAEREAASPALAEFEGGHEVVVVTTCCCLVILILILI